MRDRVNEIAQLIDAVVAGELRTELVSLLSVMAGRFVLVKERARDLRERGYHVAVSPSRMLTVAQATAIYPVSRSFLYERGEELGVAHRPDGTRRLLIIEEKLKGYLSGLDRG